MSQGAEAESSMRVGLISLGCAKNLVDAEVMLGALTAEGAEVTEDLESADVVFVNTCSFLDSAKEESVNTILESDALREASRREQALVVSGCLSQRYRDELPKLMPEVDAFMGVDEVESAPEIARAALDRRRRRVATHESDPESKAELGEPQTAEDSGDEALLRVTKRPRLAPDYAGERFRLTEPYFAYLKIAEGCNHPCAFCSIPRMRGGHRSRPMENVIEEARRLVGEGVREINLISQDSTYYGLDLRPERTGSIASPDRFVEATSKLPPDTPTLAKLLRELNEIEGEFWIRVLYTHPAHWTDELIETIASCPKVAKYVDIPLQHIHPMMLQRMRRETSKQYIVDLIDRIRRGAPGIAIRTTFIVGMPGETEERFQDLLDFVEDTRFERLGVFAYSKEEGTPAASMEAQVHGNTKKRRRRQIMEAQARLSAQWNQGMLGRRMKVLLERPADENDAHAANIHSWEHGLLRDGDESAPSMVGQDYWLGRSEYDAPEIDGRVFVRGEGLTKGAFVDVEIDGYGAYDLVGAVADPA